MLNDMSVPTWSLPFFFYQIPQKIAMLTYMTNIAMNVTYHHDNDLIMFLQYSHRNIISIHASNKDMIIQMDQ